MTQANRHNPDRATHLHLRIPGWLKNALIDAADTAGVSLTEYVATTLYRATHDAPVCLEPPRPMPTVADTIRDYLAGESTVAPCGERYPCAGSELPADVVAGYSYCARCSVRLG